MYFVYGMSLFRLGKQNMHLCLIWLWIQYHWQSNLLTW